MLQPFQQFQQLHLFRCTEKRLVVEEDRPEGPGVRFSGFSVMVSTFAWNDSSYDII